MAWRVPDCAATGPSAHARRHTPRDNPVLPRRLDMVARSRVRFRLQAVLAIVTHVLPTGSLVADAVAAERTTAAPAAEDPFSVRGSPEETSTGDEREQSRRRREAEEILKHATDLTFLRHGASGDADFLDEMLSLLHRDYQAANALSWEGRDVLDSLARHRWLLLPGESLPVMLSRLENEVDESTRDKPSWDQRLPRRTALPPRRMRDLGRRYTELTGNPWPLDWRSKRGFWLDFIATMIRSVDAEDAALVWQQKILADAANAELYRMAYLRVMRQRHDEDLDMDMVAPLLDPKHARVMFHQIDVLATLPREVLRERPISQGATAAKGVAVSEVEPVEPPQRKEIRER